MKHPASVIEAIRTSVKLGLSPQETADKLGMTRKAVRNIAYNHKLGPWQKLSSYPSALRPCPDDFAENWSALSLSELRAEYACTNKTLYRWADEKGVSRDRRPVAAPRKPPATRRSIPFRPVLVGRMPETVRDHSAAGQAAEYLRRLGPVSRCNAAGAFDPLGNHWWVGNTRLTSEELIERADEVKARRARLAA